MRQMKKNRRIGKWLLFCVIMLVAGFGFQRPALALSSQAQYTLSPGDMKVWDNGANVTKTYSGQGTNCQTSVQANTVGLNKGYYSVYLYDLTAYDVKPYDGVSFHFQNQSSTDLKINLTFTINSSTSVSMTDASYAILESADQSVDEIRTPSYGTLSIPPNFNGTVYIPFSKLYTSDGKGVSLSKIQSWGITTVLTENEQVQYQIGNIQFLSGSMDAMRSKYYQISLSGNDTIVIPRVGSTIEMYQAQIKDMDGNIVTQTPTYYLKENIPGVTLSAAGELQISSNCTASSVAVDAKLGDSVTFAQKTITLKKSTNGKNSTGVPKPFNVPKITKPAYAVLNRLVWPIRIAGGVITVILIAIIMRWFLDANHYYIQIREKLFDMVLDREEKEKR